MLVSGAVRRRISVLQLARISDVELLRSLAGRLLGYGQILISDTDLDNPADQQSDQQRHSFGKVTYVHYPEAILAELQTRLDAEHAGEPRSKTAEDLGVLQSSRACSQFGSVAAGHD